MTKAEKAKFDELLKLLNELTTALSSITFTTRQSLAIGSPFMARETDDLLVRAFATIKENSK